MRRHQWTAAIVLVSAAAGWAAPVESAGRIDEVTVYRGQALVTRIVNVPGPAGLREIIVTELPDQIDAGSIYAETADGVEVRSVRYRTRPVSEDVREEVQTLDEEIRSVQDELKAVETTLRQIGENRVYLQKLEQFVAPTANAELTRGVLDAGTLEKLTTFIFQQRERLMTSELELNLQQRDQQEQLELLQRKRNEITSTSSRTAREAVVFANLSSEQGGKLRVRYLVNNATWLPSYNVRANGERSNVLIEYNASIQQRSGEDWNDVAMTLSTATPSLIAKAPALEPMKITLRPFEAMQQAQVPQDAKDKASKIRRQIGFLDDNRRMNNYDVLSVEQQEEARQLIGANQGMTANGVALGNTVFDVEINRLAGELQNMEIANPLGEIRSCQPEEVASVTYTLGSRVTMPSRSDQQLIQIASREMPADFFKLAIPVLTSQVYEEAAIINEGGQVLLAGPVSAYLAGKFVGHCDIPTVSVGETFTVGFGIDSSLRATRELVNRKERPQGGNRVVDFTYRLTIENFSGEPAEVRLLDRLPQASESQIRLTLADPGQPLSEDAAYQKNERKNGILRWDVEVPGRAAAADAWSLEYNFTLEYDRNMMISGMAVTQR